MPKALIGPIGLRAREHRAAVVHAVAGLALRRAPLLSTRVGMTVDPGLAERVHAVRPAVDRLSACVPWQAVALDQHADVALELDALRRCRWRCELGILGVGRAVAGLALQPAVAREKRYSDRPGAGVSGLVANVWSAAARMSPLASNTEV